MCFHCCFHLDCIQLLKLVSMQCNLQWYGIGGTAAMAGVLSTSVGAAPPSTISRCPPDVLQWYRRWMNKKQAEHQAEPSAPPPPRSTLQVWNRWVHIPMDKNAQLCKSILLHAHPNIERGGLGGQSSNDILAHVCVYLSNTGASKIQKLFCHRLCTVRGLFFSRAPLCGRRASRLPWVLTSQTPSWIPFRS